MKQLQNECNDRLTDDDTTDFLTKTNTLNFTVCYFVKNTKFQIIVSQRLENYVHFNMISFIIFFLLVSNETTQKKSLLLRNAISLTTSRENESIEIAFFNKKFECSKYLLIQKIHVANSFRDIKFFS